MRSTDISGLLVIDHRGITKGIVVTGCVIERGAVAKAPPIMRWCVGMPAKHVSSWARKHRHKMHWFPDPPST